jgi:hypothetical protein
MMTICEKAATKKVAAFFETYNKNAIKKIMIVISNKI